MSKYVIGVAVVLILAASAFIIWQKASTGTPEPEPVATTTEPQAPITHTYASSTFSIVYPDGFTVDESYKYQGVPKKPIAGVKFTIPGTMATGTNLSADSGVSVESLPRAKSCSADIYFYDNVKAQDSTFGSNIFSVASSSDAGAGNFYEEIVYAVKDSKPCIAVRYFIHTTNIDNYPSGTVQAYDRDALLKSFDSIRDSIHVGAPESVATTTPAAPTQ